MSEHFSLIFNLSDCLAVAESGTLALPLIDFLRLRLTPADVDRLPELFASGCICVDNEVVSADFNLLGGAMVRVSLPGHREDDVDAGWRLLWQNSELMAVYKPHLLPVSRTTRNLYNTLISLVRRQTPYYDARLLHRLDSETAGVVLLAKHASADRRWKPRLDQLITGKIYHAWVAGIPVWQTKTLLCDLSERAGSAIRSQVYVVDASDSGHFVKPRHSKTAFRVLYSEAGNALIECRLYTGRKHQIRAQLSYLGHPVLGDKIYGHRGYFYLKRIEEGLDDTDFRVLGSRYHRLQAVEFTLNIDGDRVKVALPAQP
ncbi:23S rRNA pseudouridine1911/1915/1917 synthase [Amphritea atlantica]|uniref:23S rRNA pseudouridine1911/1915/1917 synthase n=1 Tax=Amphritea atlantica TaxID=355243 RepID=A0A1H9I337_9GAMM|nr:RluA family pseudouridine synthase [Amphritea atlantica]SEQ69091.1 23S rRNA pseudouridine1911/1915/1917 synthase [Amphritea atlantica]